MQNLGKLSIVALILILTVIEEGVSAAPQGRELYEEHGDGKRAKETPGQATTEEQTKHIIVYSPQGRTDLEIQIGEATDKPEIAIVDPEQHQHQVKDHNVKTRQTAEQASQDEIDINEDELVASLIRQRNDYIAAAGIPEPPRPSQAMRLNMNSGL